MNRDQLLEHCMIRQGGICIVCGYNLEGNADLHEAIVKKGDVWGNKALRRLIFHKLNCVAVHHGSPCHENTKWVDDICSTYLIGYYGLEVVQNWIRGLGFKVLPGRAQEIMRRVE